MSIHKIPLVILEGGLVQNGEDDDALLILDLDAFEYDQSDEDVISYWNSRSPRAQEYIRIHRPDIIDRLKELPGAKL